MAGGGMPVHHTWTWPCRWRTSRSRGRSRWWPPTSDSRV